MNHEDRAQTNLREITNLLDDLSRTDERLAMNYLIGFLAAACDTDTIARGVEATRRDLAAARAAREAHQ